jgi:hypothetical protein
MGRQPLLMAAVLLFATSSQAMLAQAQAQTLETTISD